MISFYVYKYIFIAVFRAVLRVSLKINRIYTYIAINRGTLISGQSTPCTIIIHIVGKIKTVLVTRQVSHSLSLCLFLYLFLFTIEEHDDSFFPFLLLFLFFYFSIAQKSIKTSGPDRINEIGQRQPAVPRGRG